MAERNERWDANAWLAALRQLRREVELLRRALERDEERADSVAQNLMALEKAIQAGCEGQSEAAPLYPPSRTRATNSTFLLQLAAQSGVEKLEMARLANGAASVRIDGGKVFQLSPALADLLEALALNTTNDEGNLVGWKSLSAVSVQLETRIGRPFSPHAIHQLVSRLRSALAVGGGVNPFLVQTDRRLGLRFALRKQPRA